MFCQNILNEFMKKIYYIGFYDILRNGKQVRQYPLAAAHKIDFVINTIRKLGYIVQIISPIYIIDKQYYTLQKRRENISDGVELVLPFSIVKKNFLSLCILKIWLNIWLFVYLLQTCKKEDIVVVYHNYAMAFPIYFAQKIKKFHIILEIEEQFSEIWNIGWWNRWKEKLMLSLRNDHSLVVSDVLAKSLDIKNPIISYGAYSAVEHVKNCQNIEDEICLIYTGTIDKVKMSAYLAVRSMMYLPKHYKLKISGPINKGEEDYFIHMIEEVNHKKGITQVEYLGILDNANYEKLLNEADIALNPQQDGVFSTFLFPSKILTYLSHGLPVVSTKGESIVKSSLADIITFAEDFTEESIAKAIVNVKIKDKNFYIERIKILSDKFSQELSDLLGSFN